MTHVLAFEYFPLLTAIKIIVIMAVIPLGSLVFVYVFLFKMMSHMQSRLGPMEAGPHGALQPVVEAIKFLQKEDIFPERADRLVFGLAPFVVLVSTFLLYAVVPAGPRLVVEDLDTGIFFAMAISSVSVIGVLMAGWASANKYALIGGLRAAGQLIAYELPLILAVVGVVIQAGTLSLQGIVHAQADGSMFGVSVIGNPYVFTQIIGFVIFLIAAQAELTQTPFDMPVAESELVAGYMTEYTGFRFLFFFIGEFGTAFAFAALASTLFLGGWYIPGVHGTMADVLGPVALAGKIMALGFLIFWVRFTYPRLREDQLQKFAWKFLIPLSLLNIVGTAILKVVR
ncbi:MAG: NADH-quinone oxidoreductase subunit [Actinomycetota bacterium]|jgi:NADH-quinone oxidoreductase subunit H